MTNPPNSNQNEPGKNSPRKHENDPALEAEFTKALAAWTQATAAGQAEQAEAAALQMFRRAAEEAERNPSPELLLMEQARACQERGDWGVAESIHRKLLAMAEISDEAPRPKYGHIFKIQLDLCNLFLLQSEYPKARESAAAAVAAAPPADLPPLP